MSNDDNKSYYQPSTLYDVELVFDYYDLTDHGKEFQNTDLRKQITRYHGDDINQLSDDELQLIIKNIYDNLNEGTRPNWFKHMINRFYSPPKKYETGIEKEEYYISRTNTDLVFRADRDIAAKLKEKKLSSKWCR